MRRFPVSGHLLTLSAVVLSLASCASTSRNAIEPLHSTPVQPRAQEAEEATVPETPPPAEPTAPAAPQETPRTPTQYADPFAKNRLLMYRLDVGTRKYDGSWDPIDDPLVLAAGVTYEPEYWPLGIEAGFNFSTADEDKDGSGYRSTNYGVTFGGTKSFWPIDDKLIWTFGGGLAVNYLRERLDIFDPDSSTRNGQSGSDWWVAGYLHTRLAWKFSDTFDIGLDLGGMGGQSVSTVGPVRSSSNGQLLLSFGFHR